MVGAYIGKLDRELTELAIGLKLDFVWAKSKNNRLLTSLAKAEIEVYYPVGIFAAQNEQEISHAAIDRSGALIKEYAGWYTGLCPTDPEIIEKRREEIKQVFRNEFYDGVFLDTIRYPTYWEDKRPEYLDTCYCKRCQKLFAEFAGSWEKFRVTQIENFVSEVAKIKEGKILGYFAVPETEERLSKVFAQTREGLARYVDLVSPMIYPQMVGMNLEWAKETVTRFVGEFRKSRVLPIMQVIKMPEGSAVDLRREIGLMGCGLGLFMLDQVKDKPKLLANLINLR